MSLCPNPRGRKVREVMLGEGVELPTVCIQGRRATQLRKPAYLDRSEIMVVVVVVSAGHAP
uniref:Uncharacterized protein n=1 Tax=Romanomermis culicivorax TaxID=13658 RepID=A0A915JMN2_ROMCU